MRSRVTPTMSRWSSSSTEAHERRTGRSRFIGDCKTAALMSRARSIDWLCWPRFDSSACFATLLGTRGPWLGCGRVGGDLQISWAIVVLAGLVAHAATQRKQPAVNSAYASHTLDSGTRLPFSPSVPLIWILSMPRPSTILRSPTSSWAGWRRHDASTLKRSSSILKTAISGITKSDSSTSMIVENGRPVPHLEDRPTCADAQPRDRWLQQESRGVDRRAELVPDGELPVHVQSRTDGF
jgi:hypothetical protein